MINPFKKKEEEENPWDTPDKPEPTEEEITKAIEEMKKTKTKTGLPWWKLDQILLIPWALVHFAGLYVFLGSAMSGFIVIYVLVSLYFSTKYFLLIGKVHRK